MNRDPIGPVVRLVFMIGMQGLAAWLVAMVLQTVFDNFMLSLGIGVFLTASLSAILSLFVSKSVALREATALLIQTPGGIALIMVAGILMVSMGMLVMTAHHAGATIAEATLSTVIVMLPQALGYYLLSPQMIEDLFSDQRYQQWVRWVQRGHTARTYIRLLAAMEDMNTHIVENALPEVQMVAQSLERELRRTHRGVITLYRAQHRQSGHDDATMFYEEILDMLEALPYEQQIHARSAMEPEGGVVWD